MTRDNKLQEEITVTRDGSIITTDMLETDDVLSNAVYESLTNEQFNFTPIVVLGTDVTENPNVPYYIVNTSFQVGDKAYTTGNQISADVYSSLSTDNKNKVTTIAKSTLNSVETLPSGTDTKRYYFCTNAFTSSASDSYSIGAIISSNTYSTLLNEQKNFAIDGLVPSETSTLYVAREANIDQLSSDRIITVSYWYDYIESDETGSSYENIREKHIVNMKISC